MPFLLDRIIPVSSRVCIFSTIRFCSNLALNISTSLIECSKRTYSISKSDLETLVIRQCRYGKFYDLVENVISIPSVLLAACENLNTNSNAGKSVKLNPEVVDMRFSIEEMSKKLKNNVFDVASCCVRLFPSRKKGESYVFPNLQLKVVMEAIRMVLEVVYDKRFVTFSYGGRVGMGRHTALRYLRSSIANPSWWFRIEFQETKFDHCHFLKLVSIIEEKIDDILLIDFIRRLFEEEILNFEFGRGFHGRGFPQESSLNAILINIYLNGLDKEIQSLRLRTERKNLKFHSDEISHSHNVFYKPVKIYAVRYLDEILVITSGSKLMTLNLKNHLVKFLETLDLRVDKFNSEIHSAISEKVVFLGMELQAVPPSVLYPPMSDKAIRARKKYLTRKKAKSLELQNARKTIRKKLGLKILSHVFKKLKRGVEFKFDVHIENEIKGIIQTWGQEVVREFFESTEECYDCHRNLSSGDFLSLRVIRDQLPHTLVEAYDKFQEQVDKYMKPTYLSGVLEEEERQMQKEQTQYDKTTMDDLTKLCMKVAAPMELIRSAVKMTGFTNSMGRPRPIKLLIALEDCDIIKWYSGVGRRWLDFFCCCHNFRMVKTIVNYHLRFSCILTLAEKHEATKREAIKHYTKDLKTADDNGMEEVYFPTEREIKMMGDKNLSDPKPVDGVLSMALIRLVSDENSHCCVAHFCHRTDTVIYRVRLLQNRLNVNPLDPKKWVPGMGAIHESVNRKCLPLCSDHISDLYLGKITLQDIDCTLCFDLQ